MTRRRLALAIATATLATAVPAAAQPVPTPISNATEEPVLVTDPVLLESMGFEPDATTVYVTQQALREMAMDPAERAAAQYVLLEESRTAQEISPAGGPYGTGTVGYAPVPAEAIRPSSSQTQHFTNEGRVCISGPPVFEAHFDGLPHGARLERVHIWYLDRVDDHDIHTSLYRLCHPDFGAGEATYTLLGSHSSDGSGGFGIGLIGTSPDGLQEDIDLQSCAYVTRDRKSVVGKECP